MSCGIVICSVCQHELHQSGSRDVQNGWQHCDSKKPMCDGGQAAYPESDAHIKGKWCGRDRGPSDYGGRGVAYVPQGKVGNNDPCPCGSGQKFKRCCRP